MAEETRNHGRVVPTWLTLLDNVPTAVLFALGAVLMGWAWRPLAAVYLAYCVLAIVLFWARICPHCPHFATRACPCGYGVIAARLFAARPDGGFQRAFRRNIGVVFPCWFVPPVAGGYLLWMGPTWPVVAVLAAFCVVGFAVIPIIAKRIGCRGCGLREDCPWMAK